MKLASLLHSKLFVGITAAVVSAAAVVTGIMLKNHDEDYRVIKVFEVNGQALVERSDVGEIDPYSGMNLENGDKVSTFKDSTMRIVLDDTKYVFMEQESQLELEASGNASDSKTRLVLKSGAILNEITEQLSAGSAYEVTAPKATMAVHGTSFRVSVSKDDYGDYITKLEVFHGTVKVCLLDENGNPTDKTAMVGPDKCIIIKTVHNEHSGNDPSIDGTSFFVTPDENGYLVIVPDGEDPRQPIDYNKIPYSTLEELYKTDAQNEITLYEEVIEKIIEAMNGQEGNSHDDTPSQTDKDSSSETTTTTTTKALSSEPDETTTTKAHTTTKAQTTTAPVSTTAPKENGSSTSTTAGSSGSSGSSGGGSKTTTKAVTTTTTTTTAPPPPVSVEYTVKFYDYDGTLLSTQTVEEGGSATAPTNYKGSYVDDDGWTWIFSEWDKSFTKIKADTTITAVYTQKPHYTVIFKDYDGTQLSKQTVEEGKNATAPKNYKGSYTDEDGWTWTFSEWDKPFTSIKADTTVTAVYVQKPQYTVIFKDYDGTKLSEQTIEEGKDATAPKNYKGTYIDEDGWTWTFSEWDKPFTSIKADTTVTAVYKQKPQYTVIFKDYDGTKLSEQTIEEGKNATAPKNYKGSYTDDDGWTWTFSEWDNPFTKIKADTTVTAVYTQKPQYTVIFKDYDGTQLSKQTIEEGKDATAPKNYKGTYIDDDGWTWTFSEWDKSFTSIKADTTITAVYTQKPHYTVIFKDYDGTQLSKQTIEEGKNATAPKNYKGSYIDEDGWTWTFSEWDKPFTGIEADTTVTAVYKQKPQYTVIFKDYDGTELSKQTIEEGKDATAPKNYKGTYTDEDGWTWIFSEWDKPFTNIKSDTTVTAVYTQKPHYTVIFKDYDGTQLSKQTIEEGKDATAPKNYKGSYTDDDGWTWTFSEWDKSFVGIESDTTVTAVYTQKPQYTVIFKDYDGTKLSEQTIEEGKNATAPKNYKGSYTDDDGWTWTFSEWDKPFVGIEADTTVNAVYKQKPQYTVIFKDYDGTQLSKQTIEEGKDATAPKNYKGTYIDDDGWTWTFSEWDNPFTKIKADTTVTAVYTQKPQYTVIFKDYDGTQLSKQTIEEGKNATAPKNYKGTYTDEDGWTWIFSEWDKSFVGIESDTTVTAVYTQKPQYTVIFKDYDGTKLSEQTIEEGKDAAAPKNYKGSYIDDDGWTWTFSEWDKSFTSIKADTTVTAVYVQKPQYTVIFKDYDGTKLSEQTIEEGKDATAPKNYKGTYIDEDGWTWTFSEWDKSFTSIKADTTVTAVYVQKPQYTVIFKDYDGTQLSKQTIEEGKNATAPKNYKGSYTDDDGWTWTFSEWDKSFVGIESDTTVTAVYKQKTQYTVIFKDYDGTELSKQTIEEGKNATAPKNYKGSYTDDDGWTWTFSEWDKSFTSIKADTTVTAVYVQKPQYTVIFKDYDGTQLSKQTIEEGKNATAPKNYKGSYTDDDGWTWTFSEWDKPFTSIEADTTVTAVYKQKPQYTVIFKDYDGTQLSKQTVEEGKNATAPKNYKGSYIDEDGWTWTFSEWDKPFTGIEADTTVTAVYKQKPQYTVIFKDYDGTQLSKQTIEEGKDATAPKNYKGTYIDDDGWTWTFSEWDKSFTSIKADTTVTAVYKQKPQYTVIFKDYDGTQLSKQTIEEGKNATAPKNYKGSYIDEDGWTWTFSEWDKPFTGIEADTTVTAVYKQKPQYTVIFKDYDGTQLSKQTIEEGKDATAPKNYKGTYIDDDGWTWTFSEWDNPFTKIKADTTVTAVYTQKPQYTVIFKDYDGTQLSKQTIEEGKDATAPKNYKGSYTDDDGWTWIFSEWDKPFTNIKSDTTVTAIYKQKPHYTVIFKDYDGTKLSEQTIEEGKDATAPKNYKGTYTDDDGWTWTFSEWDKSFTSIKADTTVTAVYVQKPQYTVIFKDYDGTQLSKQTIEEGKDATAPKNYKGSYTDEDGWTWTFSEWDKPFTGIEADTTVNAVYKQKPQYTVIFKDYDGTQLSKQTIEEGKDATAPKNYKGTYIDDDGWTWTFSEWDKSFTKIKSDTTVTAVYVQKPHYTVIFKDYDGTKLSEQTIEDGESAEAPAVADTFELDGAHYIFDGWDKDYEVIHGDLTVNAVYRKAYEVKFLDAEENQIGETQIVAEGEDAVPPTDGFAKTIPTADGELEFIGWDGDYTNITSETILVAMYAKRSPLHLINTLGDSAKDISPEEGQPVDSDYELDVDTSEYLDYGYNYGWFHATSGLMVESAETVTTAYVSETDENNFYVLTRYSHLNISDGNGSAPATLICMNKNEYYLIIESSGESVPLHFSSYLTNPPKVLDHPLSEYIFKTSDGKELKFSDLGAYLSDLTEPVLLTDIYLPMMVVDPETQ